MIIDPYIGACAWFGGTFIIFAMNWSHIQDPSFVRYILVCVRRQ